MGSVSTKSRSQELRCHAKIWQSDISIPLKYQVECKECFSPSTSGTWSLGKSILSLSKCMIQHIYSVHVVETKVRVEEWILYR